MHPSPEVDVDADTDVYADGILLGTDFDSGDCDTCFGAHISTGADAEVVSLFRAFDLGMSMGIVIPSSIELRPADLRGEGAP
jgi:hypothetical protein